MIDNLPTIAIVASLAACVLVAVVAVMVWYGRDPDDPNAAMIAELTRAQADTAARLNALMGHLTNSHSQLQRSVNERLDSVSHRLGDSMQKTTQNTAENLQKLNERLAVIDNAQKNITALTTQVSSLQSVLANKQSRGAFGQWRLEAIVQDSLPKGAYAFQYTLSNRSRPDCCVFMPDKRALVIDAKFPLEGVTAYRDAKSDEDRKAAAARLRIDIGKHVGDIAEKYLIPGETQDLALMFVPSEAVYAEVYDGFDDLVQKAYRARVVLVSPSLLMLAIALVQQAQKDARMREAADQIRDEVARLVKDVGLLGERIRKLQGHFNQSNEDIRQAVISIGKIEAHGERIHGVELAAEAAAGANVIPVPVTRKLEAGE